MRSFLVAVATCLATSLVVRAQTPPPTTATAPSTSTDNSKSDLPESEIELRAELSEIDAQLIEVEAEAKGWKQLRPTIVGYRGAIQDVTVPDLDKRISDAEKANAARDTAALNSALASVISGFFSLGTLAPFSVRPQAQQDVAITTNTQTWSRKLQAPLKPFRENGLFQRHGDLLTNIMIDEPPGVTELSPADINDIRQFNTAAWKNARDQLLTVIDQWLAEIDQNQKGAEARARELRARRAVIAKRLETPKVEINQLAIKLGLPLFCATVCILFCIPLAARWLTKDTNVSSTFNSGVLVEINTVLLLTMTILILGLAGKIQGEVLGTLLGGISGYVLNRIRQQRTSESE